MALTKRIKLRNGAVGSYLRIDELRFSWPRREAVIWVSLFKDKKAADAAPDAPLLNVAAHCIVAGTAFDKYFARSVLAKKGVTALGQAYRCIKAAAPDQPLHKLVVPVVNGLTDAATT